MDDMLTYEICELLSIFFSFESVKGFRIQLAEMRNIIKTTIDKH